MAQYLVLLWYEINKAQSAEGYNRISCLTQFGVIQKLFLTTQVPCMENVDILHVLALHNAYMVPELLVCTLQLDLPCPHCLFEGTLL